MLTTYLSSAAEALQPAADMLAAVAAAVAQQRQSVMTAAEQRRPLAAPEQFQLVEQSRAQLARLSPYEHELRRWCAQTASAAERAILNRMTAQLAAIRADLRIILTLLTCWECGITLPL